MEELLYKQQAAINGMRQLWSNFKKDGQDRKTSEYIKKKIETLNRYWNEFQKNHERLCMYEDKNQEYFTGNYYEENKAFYIEARDSIQGASLIKPTQFGRQQPGASSAEGRKTPVSPMLTQEFTTRGTESKFDEKLRKQGSNFKAFARFVSSVDLSAVEEKWEFEDILKTLETRWKAVDGLHWKIDSEFDEVDETYETSYTHHEQMYYNIKKQINRKLFSVSHREKSTPQLDIPVFAGNYQNWVSFKDLFTEAIHGNPYLSAAQKMQFLKSKIKGEPERLIQHLAISSDNYIASWDILNHRYNNKKLIFSTHINTFVNIPVMQQATSKHIKRIHDVATECLNGIKNLGVNTDTWDPMIVHLLTLKMDSETLNEYFSSLKQPRELPSLKEFLEFLENKFTTMESSRRKQDATQKAESPSNSENSRSSQGKKYFVSNKATSQKTRSLSCPVCKDHHGIYYCKEFKEMAPALKRKTISQLNFCTNCLYSHNGKSCTSSNRCRKCKGQHNTVLHDAYTNEDTTSHTISGLVPPEQESRHANHVAQQKIASTVLLATAIIKVTGADGIKRAMRALIDQGSQISLITENAAQQLGLPRQQCKGVITGVGMNNNTCKGMLSINCTSFDDHYEFSTNVLIMNNLTRNLPNSTFSKPSWAFLDQVQLADPHFYISNPIDILLGADIYARIIMNEIHRDDASNYIAQETRIGWILFGEIQSLQCNLVLNNIQDIQQFWEIEDIPEDDKNSYEEDECIKFYKSTTTRLADGRYQVRLPLKSNFNTDIGESKHKAVAQLYQIERKLTKNDSIAKQYKAFIDEYLSLGHMKPAHSNKKPEYFLPHHCVLRNESTTTSLRVVFNASSKTSTGASLNDCMHPGPNLQKDLMTLILKWRQHRIAFIADIEKMFRQIWAHEDDQNLQKIVWRDTSKQQVEEYQLTTVTYGTKAAPFLAMMTLKQLANDERSRYPHAAQVIEECFYMDDLLHGSDSVASAKQLQEDLQATLKAGGFNLRKWRSNYQELLDSTSKGCDQERYDFKQAESTKALGLHWNPQQDIFTFQSRIETSPDTTHLTKRKLLSELSKLFDPLGWLTPLSTRMKVLFQDIWKEKDLKWDDKIPEQINREWNKIKQDIENINQCQIPRWIGTDTTGNNIELHGFCDASQKAYACVIYCKITNRGQTNITLMVAKSRLVPYNKNISLPKLELSGAHLLSKLMVKVKTSLDGHDIKVYGWTDSMAALGWIQGDPNRWRVFVANRVRQITKEMPSESWRYVKSAENPADCASRGLTSLKLKEHNLWWNGPTWLHHFKPEIEACRGTYSTEEEALNKQVHSAIQNASQDNSVIKKLLSKLSSFTMVVHVLARLRRLVTRKSENVTKLYVTLTEQRKAKALIIQEVQGVEFEQEIQDLKKNNRVSRTSKILNLSPFLDEEGILRVGGRLHHAVIHSELKHPIILPHQHRLTELIIDHAHKLTFHGGARVTLACIRQKYWIIGGNNATKKQIRQCVTCRKQNPTKQQPLMGDLPAARVNPSRPFMHTGVDFTGHVYIKTNKGRGVKTTKGYVSVFVCMVTKAVHLELVSDLTTSSFIAALRRMAARRGTPSHLYSDNGRNFVGASKVLQNEYEEIQGIIDDNLLAEIADMEITWHFNAPSWPSAGGLWEAAVKSFKLHLKKVIGEQKLTYEEFTTLLTQIEACLNSRPLCSISEDPEDLDFLTPSHFITGGPTLTLVETERDLRTRWQLTQRILQDLWKRWRTEYLAQLTVRSKWRQPQPNVKLDDVVLIHDDNLPPGKWAMGRVVDLHPGKDGHVRVVTLKTKNGIMKRPVIKVSVLLEHKEVAPQCDVAPDKHQDLDHQQANRSSTRRSTKKKFHLTTMVTALMLLFTFITSSECNMKITQFETSQRLYFDKVSNMMLIRDDWNLVVYYSMNTYWQSIATFNKYIQSLKQTCDTIQDQVHCDVIVLQLRHAFSELEHYNQVLQSQHSSTRHQMRQRRGLINGVGYIANSLFGVLDESFAEKYRKDISLVRENEKYLVSLWKNQTSLMEAENNLLKRTEQDMNQQLKMINRHMNKLDAAVDKLKNNIETNSVINDFNMGAIIASNMMYNLKSIQNTLLDTVTDIYNGRFNLHLITPEQLMDELSTISSKLSKDVSLPIDDIHSDLRKIYDLLEIKTRLLEDIIIFEIKLPLISRDSYEIFKTIPIPKTTGPSEMISIISVSEYISINMKKDTYIDMSEEDLRSCRTISGVYYCHVLRPIYQIKGDKNLCETENSECKTISRLCKDNLQETYTLNSYFYFCCDRCHVRTICGDQITAHQLTQAGLLSIGHGCIIKTNNFTLYSHKAYLSEIRTDSDIYAPVIAPINHIINISIPKLSLENKTQDLEQEINKVDKRIQSMKQADVMLPDDLSYHDIHHYVMIYVLVGIVGIAVIIVITRRFKCQWRVPSSPPPSVAEGSRPLPAVPHRSSDTSEATGHLDCVRVHVPRNPRVNIGTSP